MGPMARDFFRAFGLSDSDRSMHSVEAQRVAVPAVQGLHQMVNDKDVEIARLKRDREGSSAALATMRAELSAFRKRLGV